MACHRQGIELSALTLAVRVGSRQVAAVSDVSLHLAPGRVLGLVGESGCGKSLTAQAILRLGEHQGVSRISGDITLDGQSLFALEEKALRRLRGGQVAMIFQEPMTALNPVFSIGSQLTEVMRLHLDMDQQTALNKAEALLAEVGIQQPARVLRQYPDALSGGMRQRVLIAMAISTGARYIIADEPTTALDVSVQKRIIELLRRLQQQRQLGVLLVTHDFGLVAEMCDDVAVMYAGEIIETGSVEALFDQPRHPYTRALMQCRPEIAAAGSVLPVIEGNVPSPGTWPVGCRFAPRCPLAAESCQQTVPLNAWQQGSHQARCVREPEA